MKVLILDITHGGDILAEEFRKKGAEVLCVDVYHTAPEGKKLYLKSIGVEVSDVVSKSEFDLALLPAHCPDAFLEGTKYGDKKTFSDAVNEFVDSDIFRIEVTGMKGKTSTCYLLAHVLDCAGKKVFLHTSRGQGPYDSGAHHIERVMSIAPTSLLRLPKCGYDINIAEVSLGGSGKADVSIVTNLLEDYGIAKNTKKASCAKSKVFGDGINIVRKDEAPMWSFVSGSHKLDPFDDVTKVVGSPRVGERVQISFPYIGRMYKATLDSSYLSVQYIPAIDIMLHVCCKMNIAIDDIIKGLESFEGVPGRGEISRVGDVTYIVEKNPGISHVSIRKTLESLKEVDGLSDAFVVVNTVNRKVCDKMRKDLVSEVIKEYGVEAAFTNGVDDYIGMPEGKKIIVKFTKEGFQ